MTLRPRTLAVLGLLLATVAWASSGFSTGTASDPPPDVPQLDQGVHARTPEASCRAPARPVEAGVVPRCVLSFGRTVGALAVGTEGTPAVLSLSHAAATTWALPAAGYALGFEPLPAASEARVILASGARDTALFAVGGDLLAYRISTGRVLARRAGPGGTIDDLDWTADGSRIAVAAAGKAYLLNPDGDVVRSLPVAGKAVQVASDARGTHLAVAGDGGSITLIDALGDAAPRTVTPSAQPAAALAFAGGLLWVAGSDGTLRSIDPRSGEEKARIDIGAALVTFAIAPDGKRAATAARDRVIRLHALPGGEVVGRLAWHQAQIVALAWGAGPTLLSGDGDGELAVWDVGPGL